MTIDGKTNDPSPLDRARHHDGDDESQMRSDTLEELIQGAGSAFVSDLRALLREEWEESAPRSADDAVRTIADRVRDRAIEAMRRSVDTTRRAQEGVTDLGDWRRARGDPTPLRAAASEGDHVASTMPEEQEQCTSPDGQYRIVFVRSAGALFLVASEATMPPRKGLRLGERSIALAPADGSGRQKLLDVRLGDFQSAWRSIQPVAEDDP